jgi:uncharacterized protein YifE (UPF0438 family)
MAGTDYRADLTPEEERLLGRYLHFYRDLETGQRKPITPAQAHFVRVTLGQSGAETVHESAYAKHMRLRAQWRRKECQEFDRKPEDGPTEEWFTRADWKKLRRGNFGDMMRG